MGHISCVPQVHQLLYAFVCVLTIGHRPQSPIAQVVTQRYQESQVEGTPGVKEEPGLISTRLLEDRKHHMITDCRFLRNWNCKFLSEVSLTFVI